MGESNEAHPTSREIEQQLERMLMSKTFASHPTLRKLCDTIVRKHLANETVNEKTLGTESLGRPKVWNPKRESGVRQQALNLRKLLMTYYNGEGKNDLVIINIPKRSGFVPKYSYNTTTQAMRHFTRAVEIFSQTFPNAFVTATEPVFTALKQSLESNPDYAPAHAFWGEALLFYTMCDESWFFHPKDTIEQAAEAAATCLSLDPQCWLGHILMGAIHCCRFEWQEAGVCFETALKLEREETFRHFFYIAYLTAIGKQEDAIRCCGWRWKALRETELSYLPEILIGHVTVGSNSAYYKFVEYSGAQQWILNPYAYTDGDEILACNYWLTETLLACITLEMDLNHTAYEYARVGARNSRISAFAGLRVVALGKEAKGAHQSELKEKAGDSIERIMNDMEANPKIYGSINLALGYLATGHKKRAIAELQQACDHHHPLMVWLHLWPVLDPLRGEAEFAQLIERMNLPATATVRDPSAFVRPPVRTSLENAPQVRED